MNRQRPSKKTNNNGPKLKHGFKTFAEKTSIEYRKQLNLKPNDFLCAFKLCDHLKVPLLTPSEVSNLSPNHLSRLLGAGSDDWSAATIPIGNGEYIIIHNNVHSLPRQQSNVMHELGHIICKHESPDTALYDLPSVLRSYNSDQEDEAIWLGAALQLPRDLLVYHLRQNNTIQEIATLCNASEEMVQYRINITGAKQQLGRERKYH